MSKSINFSWTSKEKYSKIYEIKTTYGKGDTSPKRQTIQKDGTQSHGSKAHQSQDCQAVEVGFIF